MGFGGVPRCGFGKNKKNTPMRKFKEKFKIAIDMKWKGFKYREIAEKLGVSLDTVKSWFRSVGLLRVHYEDYVHDRLIIQEQEQKRIKEKYTDTPQNIAGKKRE